MGEVINLNKYMVARPQVHAVVEVPHDEFFSDGELVDLQQIFDVKTPTMAALCNEAMEQAYIEMHGGPIEPGSPLLLKDIPRNVPYSEIADKVRDLRIIVDKTRLLLGEYLDSFRRLR